MKKEQKATQPVDVVRVWKDPAYRASLSEEQKAQVPAHPEPDPEPELAG